MTLYYSEPDSTFNIWGTIYSLLSFSSLEYSRLGGPSHCSFVVPVIGGTTSLTPTVVTIGENIMRSYVADQAKLIAYSLDEHHGFNDHNPAHIQVMKLGGEVGEFQEAYIRWIGAHRRPGTKEAVAEELADVVITAYVAARYLTIDLDEAISDKLDIVFTRGWCEAKNV